MENQKERIDQKGCKSYKDTKSDNATSEVGIEFLEETTDHENVNIAAI